MMNLTTEIVNLLGATVLLTAFLLLFHSYMHSVIETISFQSILIGAIIGIVGWEKGVGELVLLAGITVAFRAAVIPWILARDIRDEHIWRHREIKTTHHVIVLGLITAVLAYFLYTPIYKVTREWGGVISFVLLFLSLLVIITRRNALAQVVGYVSEENALLYLAVMLSPIPMVLEFGILLDMIAFVLLAVVLGAEKRYGPLEVEELVG